MDRKRFNLSKSRFTGGLQCHLKLWYDVHNREFQTPIDEITQAIFDQGHDVGRLACLLYPKGKLVQSRPLNFGAAAKETKLLLDDQSVSAVFEATFKYQDVQCSVDILEKLTDGSYHLIEVKSSASQKPEHIPDAAIQYWILVGCGLNVSKVSVMTLNRAYVRDEQLNLRSLFKLHPCEDEVIQLQAEVQSHVGAMKRMLSAESPPDISTGTHCKEPNPCPYLDHCSQFDPVYDHPITEIWGLKAPKREELNRLNIKEIRDMPDNVELTTLQRSIVDSVKLDIPVVRDNLLSELRLLKKPIYHLDFETCSRAIPKFVGTRPYQIIPFMFSVLKEHLDGSPIHTGYLHNSDDDPRRAVALHLIESLGRRGSICVYSDFECKVIKGLIETFPDLAQDLGSIRRRLVDLIKIVKKHVYHPDFKGSFSLKSVLPALSDVDYADLEIDDGRLASVRYLNAFKTSDLMERQSIFDDLRAYCDRDTLATFKVKHALQKLAES